MDEKAVMDKNLYNASLHLIEAAIFLSKVDESFASSIMSIADRLLGVIDAPKEKINKERVDEILKEILDSGKQ